MGALQLRILSMILTVLWLASCLIWLLRAWQQSQEPHVFCDVVFFVVVVVAVARQTLK